LGATAIASKAGPTHSRRGGATLRKRVEAGQEVAVELAQERSSSEPRANARRRHCQRLLDRAGAIEKEWDVTLRISIALEDTLSELMAARTARIHRLRLRPGGRRRP
jgi:hypothetical protein